MTAAVADPDHYSIPMPHNQSGAAPSPWEAAEKRLNLSVRTVALMEMMGNCLGTLAFMWATVVLLSGFSTDPGEDFWYAMSIVSLEAFRMFSRQSRMDDQLLFKITRGIKNKRVTLGPEILYYLDAVILVVVSFASLSLLLDRYFPRKEIQSVILFGSLALASKLELSAYIERISRPSSFSIAIIVLRWGPLVAPLVFGVALIKFDHREIRPVVFAVGNLISSWLLCNGLTLTLQQQRQSHPHRRWVKPSLILCYAILPITVVLFLIRIFHAWATSTLFATFVLGNIQIPFAIARIVLSSVRLYDDRKYRPNTNDKHLVLALKVFYIMVIAQGVLYILACIFESLLSSRLRKSLAYHLGLAYKKGFEYVDMYYEMAYDKCTKDGVLAQEDLSLVRFALDILDSSSNDKKLAAVEILNSLLQHEASNSTRVSTQIIASTKAVATLINMLGLMAPEDNGIRIKLFATKVIAELAGDLKIVGIPGTIQMISSLLDTENQLVKLVNSTQAVVNNEKNTANQQQRHHTTTTLYIEGKEGEYQPSSTVQAMSTQATTNNGNSFGICKRLRCILNLLSSSKDRPVQEEVSLEGNKPWKDEDLFPVLGMLILERLSYDLDNCAEINRATSIIPKIIGFMSFTTNTTNINDAQQKQCITSSLKLIAKLAKTKGEIGMELRRKISEQPLLLSTLAEILEDSRNIIDQWEPAMSVIANLSFDKEIREEIGSLQVIIPRLMHIFLGRDESANTNYGCSMVAGESLSNLSMETVSNCVAILDETGYEVFENLKNMLQNNEYTYVASCLLQNLCTHSKEKTCHPRSCEHLLSTLPVVLEKMMNAKGKQLEALSGLASLICNVNPRRFVHTLESHLHVEAFVQKLIGALNDANKKPSLEYPRMRREIVELAISAVESCPGYAAIFREEGMMQALSKAERTPSKVEKYRVFFGDTGVVLERGIPLPVVVAKAKGLIGSATPTPGARLGGHA